MGKTIYGYCENKGKHEVYSKEEVDNLLGGSTGGGGQNNYSTAEENIGTWIDGKTLYRKVLTIQSSSFGTGTPSQGETYQINSNVDNIHTSIRCDVYWKMKDLNQRRTFPSIYFGNTDWSGQAFVDVDLDGKGIVTFELGKLILNALRQADYIYVVLEYTKK